MLDMLHILEILPLLDQVLCPCQMCGLHMLCKTCCCKAQRVRHICWHSSASQGIHDMRNDPCMRKDSMHALRSLSAVAAGVQRHWAALCHHTARMEGSLGKGTCSHPAAGLQRPLLAQVQVPPPANTLLYQCVHVCNACCKQHTA